MVSLYELAFQYRDISERAEEFGPEDLQGLLDALQDQIEVKIDSCAAIVRELELEAEGVAEEQKRLAAKKASLLNNVDRLKVYMLVQMKCAEIQRVKGARFTVAIQENPPAVVVDDESQVPSKYFVTVPKLQKSELAMALKLSPVPGAHLERGESVRIR